MDRLAKLEEEENNPMKVLENRTTDSKREMDILDALQDIRARNARNERAAAGGQTVDLVERLGKEEVEEEEERERRLAEEEDDKLVRQVFSRVTVPGPSTTSFSRSLSPDAVGIVTVKRKADGDEPDIHSLLSESKRSLLAPKGTSAMPTAKRKRAESNILGIKLKGKGKAVKV